MMMIMMRMNMMMVKEGSDDDDDGGGGEGGGDTYFILFSTRFSIELPLNLTIELIASYNFSPILMGFRESER